MSQLGRGVCPSDPLALPFLGHARRPAAGAGRSRETAMPGVLRRLVYAAKQAIDRILPFKGIPPVVSAAAEAPPMPARAEG